MRRISLSMSALLCLLAVVGCQSSGSSTASTMTPPTRAVVITGGNAGATEVYIPSTDPNNPMLLSTSGSTMECPDCRAAAIKYFQTGILEAKCAKCGATRTATLMVPPTPSLSHN